MLKKSDYELPYDLTYMCDLKHNIKKQNKAEIDSKIENKLGVTREEDRRQVKLVKENKRHKLPIINKPRGCKVQNSVFSQ